MWIVELCALFTHSQSTCNVTIVANDTNNKSVQQEKKKWDTDLEWYIYKKGYGLLYWSIQYRGIKKYGLKRKIE